MGKNVKLKQTMPSKKQNTKSDPQADQIWTKPKKSLAGTPDKPDDDDDEEEIDNMLLQMRLKPTKIEVGKSDQPEKRAANKETNIDKTQKMINTSPSENAPSKLAASFVEILKEEFPKDIAKAETIKESVLLELKGINSIDAVTVDTLKPLLVSALKQENERQ